MIPGHFYWDLKGVPNPDEFFHEAYEEDFIMDEAYGNDMNPS
jgi:hypothetical protein